MTNIGGGGENPLLKKAKNRNKQFIGNINVSYKEMLNLVKENQIKLYGCIVDHLSNWKRSKSLKLFRS